jgi:hypothetical protein
MTAFAISATFAPVSAFGFLAPMAADPAPAPAPAPVAPPAPAFEPGLLSSRAMLRSASVSQWDGRKFDKEASQRIIQDAGAAADAGRFNKTLVPKDSLSAVRAAATRIRSVHERYTRPWSAKGWDILPAANDADYYAAMNPARRDFEDAVESFLIAYPALMANEAARLGALFNATDYPSVDELRTRFGVRIRTLPMPDARDFRVEMSEAQARMIRAEIEADLRETLAQAMRATWQDIAKLVGELAEKLSAYRPSIEGDKGKTFHASAVQHIRDLVRLLPSFNLTDDAELTAMAARIDRELCRHDAPALKDDSQLRAETIQSAQAILADVSQFLA